MQKRLEGAKLAASSADTNYQETVKALEESRQLWEREMEVLCQVRELWEHRGSMLVSWQHLGAYAGVMATLRGVCWCHGNT